MELPAGALPELARVYWRPRANERSLTRVGRLWTLTTIAHTVPLIVVAVVLGIFKPLTAPVGLILIAHAWIIPELYASRGAGVVRARRAAGARAGRVTGAHAGRDTGARAGRDTGAHAERVALGFLGDLIDHEARELHARTALVLERGHLGVWLLGEAGALLVRPGGRRVHCYCVKATDHDLPSGDRIAHLLLALRTDESGFATVANLAFSGARWRLRRRLAPPPRAALDAAALVAKQRSG